MALDSTQTYLIGEFVEAYHAGRMARREMLRRVLFVTGSVAATAAALRGLVDVQDAEAAAAALRADLKVAANVAAADLRAAAAGEPGARTMPPLEVTNTPVVAENDPAVSAMMVEFPGEAGLVFAYLARPAREGRYPAIVIIHENRGVTDHFKDIARRFAKEGFVGLAVDLISRAGGTEAVMARDPMAISGALGQATNAERLADMTAGVEYLKTLPFVNTSAGFGVIGYCFGGGLAFLLAAQNPDIRAATPYYGSTDPAMLGGTRAAILAVYGADDARITAQAPDVEAALRAAGKVVETVIYPDTGHAFFNNTQPTSAQDVWRRTLAWFMRYLGT
jgi:carboxymethylenebutenolidase